MKVGQLIFPRRDEGIQLTLPLWSASVAIIVGMDYCLDCDSDKQVPLEQRQRWIVYADGDLMYLTPYLLKLTYECR